MQTPGSEEVRLPWVARFWGVYTQPIANEERFLQELERQFDGTWITPGPRITPEQALHRRYMLVNYETIHAYRQKYWAWKKGKRKSKPERPELELYDLADRIKKITKATPQTKPKSQSGPKSKLSILGMPRSVATDPKI